MVMRSAFTLLMISVGAAGLLKAEDWSAFRGSAGNGVSGSVDVPVKWSSDQNVAWKVDLPGNSNGSPIVSSGCVFLTSAENEGHLRHLHCFSADDGTEKWVRTVEFGRTLPTHKTNLYGGKSPSSRFQISLPETS